MIKKKIKKRSTPKLPGENSAVADDSVIGVLELFREGHGFLRSTEKDFDERPNDFFLSSDLVRRYGLRNGVSIAAEPVLHANGKFAVSHIRKINGLLPESWIALTEFSRLNAITPNERLNLTGKTADESMRVIDLFCPIGKGQRALIVSPPKAGKTILLQNLAHAIAAFNPAAEVMILLVDERPEEVTDIRRSVNGEVFASSSDTERGDQVRLAQLVLEYAKRKVETGQDVVLLLDSLTRLGRAFNIHQRGTGRTMSGGVDVRALEIPKRIFGAARKCEGSGSLTIIATALIETNSRMDELIFQEFKGTGNMELVLDRTLANERIFPAVNLSLSGTRREELLFGPTTSVYQALRRAVARMSPRDAMLTVQRLLRQYKTNEALLKAVGTREFEA